MTELALDRDARLALKARAHALNPVVLLGAAGLTDAVLKEIDRALAAHELIKVRVPGDDRDQREAIFARVADALGAARVQMIGKLLVLYRPRPPQDGSTRPTGGGNPRPQARKAGTRRSGVRSSRSRPAGKPSSFGRRRPQ
ncbi:MAG TPA: ribosome assembly RNA-binding protein YhbY [Burkholderiaceae bacterium]|jgi:putative YhbY family RNA-binding protein|nr:ribosome assembly RNA-binding protein YhbY [Burkholderiaceae bacterium]